MGSKKKKVVVVMKTSRVQSVRVWLGSFEMWQKIAVGVVAIGVALGTAGSATYGAWKKFDGRYLKVAAAEQMQQQINQKLGDLQMLILQNRQRDIRRRIRDFEEVSQKRPLTRPELDTLDDLRDELGQIKDALQKLSK